MAWHGVANCSSSWLAARDRTALHVVTIQSIHRRGQRRRSLFALVQLEWHGQCVMRIGAPDSGCVLVAAATAADEFPGCRMRQQACRGTLERCDCGAAANSLRAASVGDACGSWQHSQSSTLRFSANLHAQRSRCFKRHQISGVAALCRLHSCALGVQPAMI